MGLGFAWFGISAELDMRRLPIKSDARSFDQRQEHALGQVLSILCRPPDAHAGDRGRAGSWGSALF